VPDTPANDEEFGRSGNDTTPGPFPQVRLVALGECGTHAVIDAALGPVATGEQTLAAELITRFISGMLVLAYCYVSPAKSETERRMTNE